MASPQIPIGSLKEDEPGRSCWFQSIDSPKLVGVSLGAQTPLGSDVEAMELRCLKAPKEEPKKANSFSRTKNPSAETFTSNFGSAAWRGEMRPQDPLFFSLFLFFWGGGGVPKGYPSFCPECCSPWFLFFFFAFLGSLCFPPTRPKKYFFAGVPCVSELLGSACCLMHLSHGMKHVTGSRMLRCKGVHWPGETAV